jgi:hypothetical protein
VVTRQPFVGARALLDADALELAVLSRANPAAVGITAVGGLVAPLDDARDAGLVLELGDGGRVVSAPIAPGLYARVGIRSVRVIALGEPIEITGPLTLAFDGERERVLQVGQRARLRVERDGPWVIDVERALAVAACLGLFVAREGDAD